MRKKLILAGPVVLAFCLLISLTWNRGAQAAPGLEEPGPRTERSGIGKKEVEQVLSALEAAVSGRDLDGVMDTFLESETVSLFLPNPYQPLSARGTENVRKAWEVFFHGIPRVATLQLSHHNRIIQVHGDEAVAFTYQNFYLNRGGFPVTLLSRTTILLTDSGGAWRIAHLHSGGLPQAKDFLPR